MSDIQYWRGLKEAMEKAEAEKQRKMNTRWRCESCSNLVSGINAFCGQCGDAEPSIKRQVEMLREGDDPLSDKPIDKKK